MLRSSGPRAGWYRFAIFLTVALLAGLLLAACDSGAPSAPARTGNARANIADQDGESPSGGTAAAPGMQDGALSSGELGLVYQYILQAYIEKVDHTRLVGEALSAFHEVGLRSNMLPIDLAPVDLAPVASGDPDRDWAAFARGYDAIVGKHPAWAASARPDRTVIRRMLSSLGDDHTLYMEPDEIRRLNETGFSGIGVLVTRAKAEEPPYVVEVYRESPASRAGVKPGDQIMAVDGTSTDGRSVTEVVSSIRGPQGTSVVLSVRRGSLAPVDLRVVRGTVDAPPVEAVVRGGVIGVLRIRRFGDQVPEMVQQLLVQGTNRGARAWVLDLRGNPGGSIEAMARVATAFIENRPVAQAVDREGGREPLAAPGRRVIPPFPFVVLVDRETASGAEALAAAIQEYHVAPLVGTRTAGSTGIAIPRPLSDGSAVQITVRRLVTPNGVQIDKQGVQPDHEVELTVDDLQRGEDPPFLRAVELLVGASPRQVSQ